MLIASQKSLEVHNQLFKAQLDYKEREHQQRYETDILQRWRAIGLVARDSAVFATVIMYFS